MTQTADEVAAMPVGTRRALALAPGLCVTVVKTGPDAWMVVRRYDLPDDLLTLVPSAPRERREEGASPGVSVGELSSLAYAAAQMAGTRR
jgi:hypothetical protein